MPRASYTADSDHWSAASAPTFLRSLDRLRIQVGNSTTLHPGNNPVPRATQDSGLEFAKHRPYLPGDDLRHIDWNALARHDTKLVKTFRAEREAPLHVLVDASASMAVPAEDAKGQAARSLAVCLAYIALRNRDPVRAAVFNHDGVRLVGPLLRHPQRLPLLTDGLAATPSSGPTDLAIAVERYLATTRLPGVAIVLSDFLVAADNYRRALGTLLASGYCVAAVRLLGDGERNPASQTRRVRLYDVESRQERIVDLTAANLQHYQRALEQHSADLREWCKDNGVRYCTIDTAQTPSIALTNTLTAAGILR